MEGLVPGELAIEGVSLLADLGGSGGRFGRVGLGEDGGAFSVWSVCSGEGGAASCRGAGVFGEGVGEDGCVLLLLALLSRWATSGGGAISGGGEGRLPVGSGVACERLGRWGDGGVSTGGGGGNLSAEERGEEGLGEGRGEGERLGGEGTGAISMGIFSLVERDSCWATEVAESDSVSSWLNHLSAAVVNPTANRRAAAVPAQRESRLER